jgi:Tfp pilus assembly protein PilP
MRATLLVLALGALAGRAGGQTSPPAGAAPAGVAADAAAESYTYDPAGRRDPFLNLMGSGTDSHSGRRVDGVAGLTVAEISVRGVLESRRGVVAMVEGPDKKTLLVHPGDKLADGTVKAITTQGLIIVQDVSDPLSLVKQREVRKLLRSLEDVKQ